jgi:Cft2 family RNA processing exonuclease
MEEMLVEGIPCIIKYTEGPKTELYNLWRASLGKEDNQLPPKSAIHYLLNCETVPEKEKKSIVGITFFSIDKIMLIRATKNTGLFKSRLELAEKIGWYPYITGVPLPSSPVSETVNKYISEVPFTTNKKTDGPIHLIPIATISNYNSFLLKIGELGILLDAGIFPSTKRRVDLDEIDLVFISHDHSDHTSGLTQLYEEGCTAKIIATCTTLDFLFIKGERRLPLSLKKSIIPIKYDKPITINESIKLTPLNAGHVPGSAMALIERGEERILYTGDFCLRDHYPVKSAKKVFDTIGKLDCIIMECNFAGTNFSPYIESFSVLCDTCEKTLKEGKHILIAAEPEVMTQSLFHAFYRYFRKSSLGYKPPVYIENSAVQYMQATRTRLDDLPFEFQKRIINERDPYSSAMIRKMDSDEAIGDALEQPSIIITNSFGPMRPPSSLMIEIFKDQSNLFVLTGADGRRFMESLGYNKTIRIGRVNTKINCRIFNLIYRNFNLAYHCDSAQLDYALSKVRPKILIPFHFSESRLKSVIAMGIKSHSKVIVPYHKNDIILKKI